MSAIIHVTGTVASIEGMKYFESGKNVLKFSLVTPNGEPKKEGDDYAPSQFYKVELWDKQAKAMEPHVIKGAKFYVVGKHVVRQWESDNGSKGVEEMIKYPTTVEPFVWQKSEDDGEQRQTSSSTKRPSTPAAQTPNNSDVPF